MDSRQQRITVIGEDAGLAAFFDTLHAANHICLRSAAHDGALVATEGADLVFIVYDHRS